jgi:hypothetical protein
MRQLSKFLAAALVFSIALAHSQLVLAQERAPKPPTATGAVSIDKMLRAHIFDYFGDESIKKNELGIATIGGKSFDDLSRTISPEQSSAIVRMYGDGRRSYGVGTKLKVVYDDIGMVVHAISDGGFGISKIDSIEVADGTRIQLKSGTKYVFAASRWKKD